MALIPNINTPGAGLKAKLCEILGFDVATGTKTVTEPGGFDDSGNKLPDRTTVQRIEDTITYQALVRLLEFFVQFNEISTMPTAQVVSPNGVVAPLAVVAGAIPGPGTSLPTPVPVTLTGATIVVPSNPVPGGGPVK